MRFATRWCGPAAGMARLGRWVKSKSLRMSKILTDGSMHGLCVNTLCITAMGRSMPCWPSAINCCPYGCSGAMSLEEPYPSERLPDEGFGQMVAHLCARRGMFVGAADFSAVVAYIDGFNAARGGGPLLGFREWLTLRANT